MHVRHLLRSPFAAAAALAIVVALAAGILHRQAAALSAPADIPGYWITQHIGTPTQNFFFVDSDHGWASGGNAIYRTSDGGVSWQVSGFGRDDRIYQVWGLFFSDQLHGWAEGRWLRYSDDYSYSSFVMRTTDGGQTWADQVAPGAAVYGDKIWFVDSQRGWLQMSGLYRTTDAGEHWTETAAQWGDPFHTLLRFINASVGFAIYHYSSDTPQLLRTTDAGDTWSKVGDLPADAVAVWPSSSGSVVWAVGKSGQTWRSGNGGGAWQSINRVTWADLTRLSFADDLTGWAGGADGALLKTTDGGSSWQSISAGTSSTITSLFAGGSGQAWVYANGLRRTRDGGVHWSPLASTSSASLGAIRMGSAATGYAGGSQSLIGTTDGGRNWLDRFRPTVPLLAIDAVGESHAWAVGGLEPPYVLRSEAWATTDSGITWQALALPSTAATFYDLDFVTTNAGWMVGNRQVYRTTNGGQSWGSQWTSTFDLTDVSFVDTQRGWALGFKSGQRVIARTTNGGGAWTETTTATAATSAWWRKHDLDFVDASRGWLIDAYFDGQSTYSSILRTTNGGTSWTTLNPPWLGSLKVCHALDFLNATEGWVAGEGGLILHTTDGGTTWQSLIHPSHLALNAVHATAPGVAWFAGDGGQIIRYSLDEPPGCWSTPTPIPPDPSIPPASGTIDARVAHCMDDTYVRADTGELFYDLPHLNLGAEEDGWVPYADGFLFRNVRIPRNARILAAHIQLVPWGYMSGSPVVATLAGDLRPNADDFSAANTPAHLRPRTAARVPWTLVAPIGTATDSPDISAIVQEIIAQPGWQPGNNRVVAK